MTGNNNFILDKGKEWIVNGFRWFMKLIEPVHPVGKIVIYVSALFVGLLVLQAFIRLLLKVGIILGVVAGTGYCLYLVTKSNNKKEE